MHKLVQKSSIRCFRRVQEAKPELFMGSKEPDPAIERGVIYQEALTDLFNASETELIFGNDAEDKEEAIGIIGNDEVRQDRMGVAAFADHPGHCDLMDDLPAGNEINEISIIGGVKAAAVSCSAGRADLVFRLK